MELFKWSNNDTLTGHGGMCLLSQYSGGRGSIEGSRLAHYIVRSRVK